jgi:hypothetical protein
VNAVVNFLVPQKVGNLFTGLGMLAYVEGFCPIYVPFYYSQLTKHFCEQTAIRPAKLHEIHAKLYLRNPTHNDQGSCKTFFLCLKG